MSGQGAAQVSPKSPIGQLMTALAGVVPDEHRYETAHAIYQHRARQRNFNGDYANLTEREVAMAREGSQ
jgi:hypothetical protein